MMVRWLSFIHYSRSSKLRAISSSRTPRVPSGFSAATALRVSLAASLRGCFLIVKSVRQVNGDNRENPPILRLLCGLLRKSLSLMWLTRLAAVPMNRKSPATDKLLFLCG